MPSPMLMLGMLLGGVGSSKSVGKSCLTSLSLSRGSSSSNSSKMSSLGLGNLGGVNGGNGKLWVEGRGNKRLRVEGGSNSVIDRSNGETRVSNTESCSISNILNLLELSVGVNIRVSTRNSSISISNLLLDRVDVSVAVVQVAKLILCMELATCCVGSSSNHWSSSSNSGSSGIGNSGGSSNSRSSGIGDSRSSSNSGSSGIGESRSSGISNGGKSRSLNSLNLNLGWSSHSIRIASIANGTSIAKTSIRIVSIGQGGGQDLSLLSHAGSHQGGDYKELHGVHCCVMLNGVTTPGGGQDLSLLSHAGSH